MDKNYIKIETIKLRIENILVAYDEQLSTSRTHETPTCSSSDTSKSSGENEKPPFSYRTIDIESILKLTEKKTPKQVTNVPSRPKRRNAIPKSESLRKQNHSNNDSPLRTGKVSKIRTSARQRNQRKSVSKIPSIVIESDSDYDKNNSEKVQVERKNWSMFL